MDKSMREEFISRLVERVAHDLLNLQKEMNAPNINDVQISQPVSVLGLSVRAQNVLKYANIKTIGELANKTHHDLRLLNKCGPITRQEIIAKLKIVGIKLRD